jgi:insulysin
MPITETFSKEKSNSYLSHSIGHEGPNSLLSQLIKDSLATGLSAGSSARLNQAFDMFTISIALTDKGE